MTGTQMCDDIVYWAYREKYLGKPTNIDQVTWDVTTFPVPSVELWRFMDVN